MHVFVTGASGLVGAQLCRALLADQHRVTGLTRARPPAEPAGVEWEIGDPTRSEDWCEVAAGADAIVHLAGASIADGRWTEARKRELVRSRVDSTALIAESLAANPRPGRVWVCASATGYYGSGRGNESLGEDAAPGDDFLAKLCVDWERESRPAEAAGVRVVNLRIAPILSPDGGALASMLPPFKLGLGGPIGPRERWFPWVHVDDIVGLLRFAIETPVSGPMNAAAPGSVQMGEFAKTLARVLGRPALMPFPVPIAALKLALGDFAEHISPDQKVIPRRAEEAGYVFRYPELEGALRACLGKG